MSAIIDIEPPPLPPSQDWTALVITGIAIGVAIGIVFWLRSRSPGQRARRELRQLERAVRSGNDDPRRGAYRLAAILRRCLQRAHLSRHALAHRGGWQNFVYELDKARFNPQPPSRETVLGLLTAAPRYLDRDRA